MSAVALTLCVAISHVAPVVGGQSPSGFLYVTHGTNSPNVSKVDLATGNIVATIPMPHSHDIVFLPDGSRAYVPDGIDHVIRVIDTATDTVVATVSVPAASWGPSRMAVRPDGTKAYATVGSDDVVRVMNTSTNTLVGSPIPVGNLPNGIAITPDGTMAYLVNELGNSVSVLDLAGGSVLTTITSPQFQLPYNLVVSPDGSRVYVVNFTANNTTGTVTTIDMTLNTVIGPAIPVGWAPNAIDVLPDGTKLYVANQDSGNLSIISTASGGVIATLSLGGSAVSVHADPGGDFVYAGNCSGQIVEISASTNSIVGTLTVPGCAGWMGVLPTQGPTATLLLYGIDNASDQLIEIDPATGTGIVVASVSTDLVNGLAYDSGTDVLYAADLVNDSLYTIDRSSGATSIVGPIGFSNVSGLAFDPGSATLYAADFATSQLISIDTSTGSGAAIGSHSPVSSMQGLAFDTTNGVLYGTDGIGDRLVTVNTQTGASMVVGSYTARFVSGLEWDPSQARLLGSTSASATDPLGKLHEINPATGASTLIGVIGFNQIRGLAGVPAGAGAAYPGFGEDFEQAIGVNGPPTVLPAVRTAAASDLLTIHISSPGGAFNLAPYLVVAQTFAPGSPPVGPSPGLWVSVPGFVILVDGTLPTLLGPPALLPGGNSFGFVIPQGLSGSSVMIQSAAISPLALNGLYTASNAHEIQMQ